MIVETLYQAQDSRHDAGFSLFYMGINLGSLAAPLITGLFIQDFGWHIGFSIGNIDMLLSLLIFRLITVPQLTTFNHLQDNNATWNNPVYRNNNAPKTALCFLGITAVVIALVSLGRLCLSPIGLSTIMTKLAPTILHG